MKLFSFVLVGSALLSAIPAHAQSTTYAYDALGRLTSVTDSTSAGTTNSEYQYDPAGNRKAVRIAQAGSACSFDILDAQGNDDFTFQVAVKRVGVCSGTVVVNYAFSDRYPAGSLTFEPADEYKYINVTTGSCGSEWLTYTATISIAAGQATVGDGSATVTVVGNC